MGEGPEANTPLGRILLRQQQLTPQQLDSLLAEQRLRPGERLASLAARTGRLPVELALGALSEQHGIPAVDLSQVSIPLAALALVSREQAGEHAAMPLLSHEERLFMAMADPEDRVVIEALEEATGKQVLPYVALHGQLLEVIDAAYAAAAAGESAFTPPAALVWGSPGEPRPAPALLVASGDALAPGTPGVVVAPDLVIQPVARDSLALESETTGVVTALDRALEEVGQNSAPRKRSVLVVDDSDDIRRLLSRVLRDKGYEVFEADNGLAALQGVREHTPDVLLLDAMLPEVHGFDVCRRIKSSRRFGQLPVIMVSAVYRGWRFAEDLRVSYGVDHFLEKPFRVGEVLAAVQACLSEEPVDQDAEDEVTGEAGEALESGIDAYAAGDVQVAIEHLQRGIGLDPQAFRLHYHLGLLYGKQESLFEAIQTLEVAADLRPKDFSTLKNLAVLYERAGFRLKATEMWERAMGSAPDEGTKANIKKHLMSLL